LILAGGFVGASADAAIRAGQGDAVAFGRHFIANPDLPRRFQLGAPLNPYNRATFYGGDAAGYVDYPALEPAEAAE
jgi:N-ethylmaleimide reductase